MRFLTSITLAAALSVGTLPAFAQSEEGMMKILSSIDQLASEDTKIQRDAAYATCLTLGSDAEIMGSVLTEQKWVRSEEFSDGETSLWYPDGDEESIFIQVASGGDFCSVWSGTTGSKAAETASLDLLKLLDLPITNATDAGGCLKHEMVIPEAGTVYLSILNDEGEEMGCGISERTSFVTFALQAN